MKLPLFKSPIVLGQSHRGVVAQPTVTCVGVQRAYSRADYEAAMPDWYTRTHTEPDGTSVLKKVRPLNTSANVKAIIMLLRWSVRYNAMTKRIEITKTGLLIPGDDHENTVQTLIGDDAVRAGLSREGLSKLVDAVGVEHSYHPVLDLIESKPWDGVSRLRLFHETLHLAFPDKYQLRRKLMDKWALQVIGALKEPNGIAAAGALVLCGPQNCGKSYWTSRLIPLEGAVGSGLHLDPAQKDRVLAVLKYLITELGEIDSTTSRSHIGMLKAFLTSSTDVVRLPYAAKDTSFPRRTVFVGTVNGTGFLVDDTGNRRFWVLEVTRCEVLSPDVMQQVWAEYMSMYQQGQRWTLDNETLAELNASNVDHTRIDPLYERIAAGFDWESVAWNTFNPSCWQSLRDVHWRTATDVCIAVEVERPTRTDATRAGVIVRELQLANVSGSGQVNFSPAQRKSAGLSLLAVPIARVQRGQL
jgi:putative DNA primase/helicase